MTKGQMAMISAAGFIEPIKQGDQSKAAKLAGVSVQRINLPLTVKKYASHLVPQVISAGAAALRIEFRSNLDRNSFCFDPSRHLLYAAGWPAAFGVSTILVETLLRQDPSLRTMPD
jgi:hypothetical protein